MVGTYPIFSGNRSSEVTNDICRTAEFVGDQLQTPHNSELCTEHGLWPLLVLSSGNYIMEIRNSTVLYFWVFSFNIFRPRISETVDTDPIDKGVLL